MTQTATLIDDLNAYMNDARDLCERGELMELTSLNDRVQSICTAISKLPIEEAKAHAADLETIMASLDDLQRLFETKRAALGEELNDTSKHHKAAKAYTKHEHATPKEG
jgi:hypothetical protein